jgi:hypothetical protein
MEKRFNIGTEKEIPIGRDSIFMEFILNLLFLSSALAIFDFMWRGIG